MKNLLRDNKTFIVVLWLLGMLGVIAVLPALPSLLVNQQNSVTVSMGMIKLITVLQLGVLTFIAVLIGVKFSPAVKLSAPILQSVLNKESVAVHLKRAMLPSIVSGVLAGLLLVNVFSKFYAYLPGDFVAAAKSIALPWYARIFYGGITEELLLRWGGMSFLVWFFFRFFQQRKDTVQTSSYVMAIFFSSILFGVAHLPAAYALSSTFTVPLVSYIVMGNASVGFLAGWLYWRYGIECAIFFHMCTHVTMIVSANFLTPLS